MITLSISTLEFLALTFAAAVVWQLGTAIARRVIRFGLRWHRRRFADHLTWDDFRRIANAWLAGAEFGMSVKGDHDGRTRGSPAAAGSDDGRGATRSRA
jgi:hypothetical protein